MKPTLSLETQRDDLVHDQIETSQGLGTRQEGKGAVAVFAIISALGTMMSRILGLIRDMAIARYFPAETRDAFIVAFRLPNFFRRIFGEGALSVSFIPIFIEILWGKKAKGGTETEVRAKARAVVAGVFSILAAVTMTISALAILFMNDIMQVLVGGSSYMSVPGKFALTVTLARIMFGFLVFVSFYAFFMAVLNSLGKFALAALAPCLFNLTLIATSLASRTFVGSEFALAWAVLFGGALQMALLVPSVARAGFLPRPTAWLGASADAKRAIGRVVRTIIPSLIGLGLLQLISIVNIYFASYLPQGTHSHLYFADRILELPMSLLVVSVSSALLPALARSRSAGDAVAMGETINHCMRLTVFVSLPAALGMMVLAHPIVEALFLGREFKYQDAIPTANVIQIYSIGLISAAGVRILAQGFYAIRNAWFPAVAALVALVSHVFLAFALTRAFGLNGLAAASVASSFVNLLMLSAAYNSWVGPLQVRPLVRSVGKFAVGAVLMVAVLQIYEPLLHAIGNRFFTRRLLLLFTILLGAFVYFAAAHVLKIPEYREAMEALFAKLRAWRGRRVALPDRGA